MRKIIVAISKKALVLCSSVSKNSLHKTNFPHGQSKFPWSNPGDGMRLPQVERPNCELASLIKTVTALVRWKTYGASANKSPPDSLRKKPPGICCFPMANFIGLSLPTKADITWTVGAPRRFSCRSLEVRRRKKVAWKVVTGAGCACHFCSSSSSS